MDDQRTVAPACRNIATEMGWVLLAGLALVITMALCRPPEADALRVGGHVRPADTGQAAADEAVLGLAPGGPSPVTTLWLDSEDPPVVTGTDWVDSVQLVGEEAAAPAPHFEIPLLVEQQTSDIQVPLAGQAGLLMLLRAGTLKPASAAELDAWMRRYVAAGEDAPELMDRRLRALPVYTIQGEMQFPADLNDDHAAAFILDARVPYPRGSPGQSLILDMSTGTCLGTPCLAQRD